jgi:hypothetical protein
MFCSSQRRARCALALEVVVASTLLLVHQELLAAPSDPNDLLGQCKLESLPDDIRGTLTRRFGEWKVEEPKDLSRSAGDKWAAESPPSCPGIATGRFQNEKGTAYALLLIPIDRSDPEFAMVVFTQHPDAKGIYGYKLVEHGEAGASDTFLLSTTTSKYLQVDSIWKSRSHPRDSLLLVNAGAKKEAYVYYWVNDTYQRQAVNYEY